MCVCVERRSLRDSYGSAGGAEDLVTPTFPHKGDQRLKVESVFPSSRFTHISNLTFH